MEFSMFWIWPIVFSIAALSWGIYWSIPHAKK